jgi:phage baseplate assembly protein W
MPIKNQTIVSSTQAAVYNPIHVYKGFSSSNKKGSFKIYDDVLIKSDILNAFNTRKGERPMNPTFGTIIWDSLFDPLTDDTKIAIQDDIKKILNADPRIVTKGVVVDQYATGLIIDISLQIVGTDFVQQMRLTFDSNAGLTVQ